MIVYRDLEQGSDEWLKARLGVLTSTSAAKVVTPAKLELSGQRAKLTATLVAEIIGGKPLDSASSAWMERGTEMEQEALDWFAFHQDVDVSKVGFITTDDGRCGVSPDADICEAAGVEVKNPGMQRHTEYLLDNEELVKEYKSQVQFGLWVTGWQTWYLVSYNPELPSVSMEVRPDADHHAAFDKHIPAFLKELDEAVSRVRGIDPLEGMDEDGRAAAEAIPLDL